MTVILCLGGWFVLSVVIGLVVGPCIRGREPEFFIAAGRLLVLPLTQAVAGNTATLLAAAASATAASIVVADRLSQQTPAPIQLRVPTRRSRG